MRKPYQIILPILLVCFVPAVASAQSFRVQCPTSTITHPVQDANHPSMPVDNNSEPAYTGPTTQAVNPQGFLAPTANVNGAIKCQQVGGGDGYATMGNGTQTYMFSFGPLSGLADIANGQPGTESPNVFNVPYPGILAPGDPATTDGASDSGTSYSPGALGAFSWNGAVGITPDLDAIASGTCAAPCLDGHVDPRQIIDVGIMNGNIPAPLVAFDEDDEMFLTLTNVAMIIGGSFTYDYFAPDAGTYFWHCHITPPEHLQMGMVGQLYVRPRQNRATGALYTALQAQQGDLRTACRRP